MATKENPVKETPGENPAPKKRVLKKKLASFVPFVKWHPGLVVCGEVTRKFEHSGDFGMKACIEITLLDPIRYISPDGEEIVLQAGDLVNVSSVAALQAAVTLALGTVVQIECTGQKAMGKGKKDAWEFDVTYE